MFSLYRAWLSLGTGGTFPTDTTITPLPSNTPTTNPTNGNNAPDVTLQIGPAFTQFSAHKNVLANHSGYFKSLLTNHQSGPITVSNVNVDEFSSLLTFMYTGFLDLNFGNIYNILLATHMLHMPKALELCRAFLVHNTPLEPRPLLVKPIASRRTPLDLQQTPPTIIPNLLNQSENTPFKTVVTAQIETTPTNRKIVAKSKKRTDLDDKVIIDIACCDGPVRFHRVLNKNYGLKNPVAKNHQQGEAPALNINTNMNRVMNENIRDRNSEETFTCFYCNHTFKSQYCYQKHARRHLNPVSVEAKNGETSTNSSSTTTKREVKLLDMNVQYYPCKTCGSKFPSYYFVHKHRKMCHADENSDGGKIKENDEMNENSKSQDTEIDVDGIC